MISMDLWRQRLGDQLPADVHLLKLLLKGRLRKSWVYDNTSSFTDFSRGYAVGDIPNVGDALFTPVIHAVITHNNALSICTRESTFLVSEFEFFCVWDLFGKNIIFTHIVSTERQNPWTLATQSTCSRPNCDPAIGLKRGSAWINFPITISSPRTANYVREQKKKQLRSSDFS